ncbi:MAG: Ig-like domain-containing protein, partial [Clostridia bacterium]|nr:Ig-like domain-containing protein [Clostridia bacterium]
MKKLLSVLIALLVTTLTLGVVGCYNIDYSTSDSSSSDSLPDDPVVSLSVELSQSVLTLDRYEEGLLTAIVTDEEGNAIDEEVTWESDNLLVATVENGLVEATGVGSANITVSAGEASATCVVTVEDTGALPVLDVSDESIELVIGSNYSIDANLTYKRNPVEDATISYQMLDTTIATVDEEGNVSALSFGTTTLVIVASWKGIDPAYLTYEMEVSVKEDVVVEIEQTEAVEIYTSNIQLGNVSFVNSATLTSKILVEGSAEGLEESRISWASSNDEVLTVVNGVVTAVGEGTANVTVSYTTDSKTYTSTPLQVKVLFPVVEKEIKVYLDASKATIGEQITANQIFGSEETSIARIYALGESDDLALSTTWLKEHDFGSEAERTYKLVVANAEYGYSVNALVITKLIRTYEELAQLQSYTEVTEGTNAGDATYYSYGGYFMLANNIIATGEEAPFKAPSMGSISSGSHATDLAGFHGTFDGQGYVVKGFKFDIGGIFGDIGDGTVIKNVAFEDCDAAWRNFTANEPARQDGVGVLAANAAGNYLIENVFVESTGTAANAGGLVGRSMKGGTVRNSVIIYNATGGWTMGVLTAWTISAVKLENVYAIMQGKTA